MKLLNEKLWKSAYLIEFYIRGELQEAFTFSVAPQNEEFIFAQRINETKTFGGSVIDDYGNDTVKITLSGTTINQELKLIYRGLKSPKMLTGEEEIFLLRDLLKTYGNYDKLEGKEVYLYSLESKAKSGSKNKKAWRIYINELQIKRSKDMPFTYNYTLNCIGVPIDNARNKFTEFLDSIDKVFKNFEDVMEVGLSYTSQFLSYLDIYKDFVSNIRSKVETVGGYIDAYLGLVTGSIDTIGSSIEETVNLHNTVLSTTLKFVPTYTLTSLYNAVADLYEDCGKMKTWWDDFCSNESEFQKLCSNYNLAEQTLRDAFNKTFFNIKNSAAELVKITTKTLGTNSEQPITNPGNGDTDDSILIANGYKEYVYTSGDTWASISQRYYNTPDYAPMLQLYNSDITLASLTPGDILYIPIISNSASNSLMNNEVYTEPDAKDIYGSDITITNDGDIAFDYTTDGDFKIVKGVENLNQAILNRLSTSINSRIRNVVYGIRNETGSASVNSSAIASYITTSIEQTLLADPRIDTVEELSWESSNGQNINVSIVYTTTTGNISTYKGTI